MDHLRATVKHYTWGSPTAIPDLMGVPGDGRPVAEMWWGAHPDSPSTVLCEAGSVPLDRMVSTHGGVILGTAVADAFGGRLPFLTKVLAVRAPLSVQVHPTCEQARIGHERDDSAGIDADSSRRRYRDRHHKPEMVVALTHFEVLSGMRPPFEAAHLVEALGVGRLDPLVRALRVPCGDHESAFRWLLESTGAAAQMWIPEAVERAGRIDGEPYRIVQELASHHPRDPMVITPLLLNAVTLAPGQALYTGAGIVHAYLRGMAVEIMATSDNVLRAGLTAKTVDADEFLSVADLRPAPPAVVAPTHVAPGLIEFRPPVRDFALSLCTLQPGHLTRGPHAGPRVVVALDGRIEVWAGSELSLTPGQAALVSDADGPLALSGDGRAAIAHCPVSDGAVA